MTGTAEPLTAWAGRPIETLRREWGVPRLLAFGTVSSTSDVARVLADQAAPPFTTVLAEEQTAGRGRRGRAWTAPYGSALLLSILLRPATPPGRAAGAAPDAHSATPLRVGLATARAIERTTGIAARLKWPNDVLAPDGRKIAGILCEAVHGPEGLHVVAGIGINVSQRDADWPAGLRTCAASLTQLCGDAVDRNLLAGALIAGLRHADTSFGRPLTEEECAAWHRRDALRGRAVRVDDRFEGTAEGVTPEGALCLRGAAGPMILWTGTVRTLVTAGVAALRDPSDREDPR